MNAIVRDAVALGIRAEDALTMASHNPALWHRLRHLGAIAPGYQADLLLLPDLERFLPDVVLKCGRPVEEIPETPVPEWVRHTVRLKPVAADDLHIPWAGGEARVIGLVPGQIVSDSLVETLAEAVADPERDLAKIAVIERHLGTGRIGLGFVRGFGLSRGALATTLSHDAHNLVVVGMSDADMLCAIERAVEIGGGLVVVDGERVVAELPLPVAGLLSDRPLADVIAGSEAVVAAVHALGSEVEAPFQSLAFLALSVIPSLKITDHGLVDVDRFELVPLRADALVAN
jgi:adenine deaminase